MSENPDMGHPSFLVNLEEEKTEIPDLGELAAA